MIQFKACPKCQGDLIDGRDQYGSYISCIQCGRYMAVTTRKPSGSRKHAVDLNVDLAELLNA